VISGAGSGIGREIALELGRRGFPLALLGRREDSLRETLALSGVEDGFALSIDVRDAGTVEAAAREIEARWGSAAVLVPAAGVAAIAPLDELAPDDFAAMLATNLGGTFHLIRAFLPAMKRRGSGWIFPILSVAARRAFPGWGGYAASKWGLDGLVACLREELRGSGIRITALYPGATDTPIWDGLAGWDRDAMVPPREVARAISYALDADPKALIEEIQLGPAGGAL